jgi:hypothetical protein
MSDQTTLGGGTVSDREIEKKKKERAERDDSAPLCGGCGEPKEYTNEPMVSGIRGWFCMNDDCVMDS